jgi:hypothetical protein
MCEGDDSVHGCNRVALRDMGKEQMWRRGHRVRFPMLGSAPERSRSLGGSCSSGSSSPRRSARRSFSLSFDHARQSTAPARCLPKQRTGQHRGFQGSSYLAQYLWQMQHRSAFIEVKCHVIGVYYSSTSWEGHLLILADVQEKSLRRAGDLAVPTLDTHTGDGISYNRQVLSSAEVTIAIVQTTEQISHLVQRS